MLSVAENSLMHDEVAAYLEKNVGFSHHMDDMQTSSKLS